MGQDRPGIAAAAIDLADDDDVRHAVGGLDAKPEARPQDESDQGEAEQQTDAHAADHRSSPEELMDLSHIALIRVATASCNLLTSSV